VFNKNLSPKIPAMKHLILSIFFLTATLILFSQEQPKPYNPDADAKADLKRAIDQAKKENKHVLVQIGGNWCPWCLRFHAMATGPTKIDSLIKADYVYLLLNYSKENKNWDLMERFGFPNRFGFPVFVVLDGDGKELHIQDSGLLEHPDPKIKGYDTTKVVTFLKQWNLRAVNPETYKAK
jgi:thiol:disulfide interchange protein